MWLQQLMAYRLQHPLFTDMAGNIFHPHMRCVSLVVLFIRTKTNIEDNNPGTYLVAQWLRIRLPMQGTQVRALVREDPTCRGATKPVRHKY